MNGRGLPAITTAGRRPARWARADSIETQLLGPGWRFPLIAALVLGGLGGVWPVGVLGEAELGIGAAFLGGITSAAVGSLVWLPALAASCIATEPDTGVRAVRVSHGFRAGMLRRRAWLGLAGSCAAMLTAAALAGGVGAIVTNVSAGAATSPGLAGFVGAGDLTRALTVVLVTAVLCGAATEVAGERRSAVAAMTGTQLATVALLAVLYFAPMLRPVQYLSPWLGVWPLRASVTGTPLLSTDLDRDAGLLLALGWAVAVAAVATVLVCRRPVVPATRDGEG